MKSQSFDAAASLEREWTYIQTLSSCLLSYIHFHLFEPLQYTSCCLFLCTILPVYVSDTKVIMIILVLLVFFNTFYST